MDILFVATELAPFVKVGGLADVVAALSKSLRQLGHKVTLAIPKFRPFDSAGLLLARRLTPIQVSLGGGPIDVTLYDGRLASGVELVLFDVPGLYDRDGVYGVPGEDYEDNVERFALFSRAVAELIRQRSEQRAGFDVVHVHDWPTALVPMYLRWSGLAAANAPPTVLTLHNLAHQGIFPKETLPKLGLPWEVFEPGRLEFFDKLNLLKGGMIAADRITTVSSTYAEEIQTELLGCGLDGVLRSQSAKLSGIVNGVDYATWNPSTDPAIVARFDAEDAANKGRCKTAILHELGLELEEGRPLLAFVGRMVPQKGIDLLQTLVTKLMRANVSLAVIGDGPKKVVDKMTASSAKYPERVAFVQAAPEGMVHRLFAGADFVALPSRFEPCGLVQLYAQRYGALPIAHATGGLKDTIVDCDAELETGTGFLFDEPTTAQLFAAIQRALGAYAHPRFPALRRRVMRLDLGWDRAARRYEKIYRSLGPST